MTVQVEELILNDPNQQQILATEKIFPKIYRLVSKSSLEECCAWLKENQQLIEQELEAHAALMFRDFPIKTPETFHDFLLSLNWDFRVKYTGGGGPRNIVIGPIYNSTDSPPEFIIPFHHEMAYLNKFPERLIFYCDIATAVDGETPLLFSNDVIKTLREINPTFIETLLQKGVRYIRRIASKYSAQDALKYQKGWEDIFETEDRATAEKLALECGTETISWSDDNTLNLTTVVFSGVEIEPRTGLETWFNAICLLHPAAHKSKTYVPWDVVYGDFSPINDDDVQTAIDVMAKAGIKPKWEQGDMMLVDNRLAMHGRNKFVPPRRILAAFAHRE